MQNSEELLLGGVYISMLNPTEAWSKIRQLDEMGLGGSVHLCNAFTLALASRSKKYQSALTGGALRLADGVPLRWVAQSRGNLEAQLCRGPDLMREALNSRTGRHVFLGGEPAAADLLTAIYRDRADIAPPIKVPFVESAADLDLGILTKDIRDSRADYVWIGMGTPKQDDLAALLAPNVSQVLICVGAAFNFLCGSAAEAPTWLRGSGLEWAYRFSREPRRTWKRYSVHNARFAGLVIKECRARRRRP